MICIVKRFFKTGKLQLNLVESFFDRMKSLRGGYRDEKISDLLGQRKKEVNGLEKISGRGSGVITWTTVVQKDSLEGKKSFWSTSP